MVPNSSFTSVPANIKVGPLRTMHNPSRRSPMKKATLGSIGRASYTNPSHSATPRSPSGEAAPPIPCSWSFEGDHARPSDVVVKLVSRSDPLTPSEPSRHFVSSHLDRSPCVGDIRARRSWFHGFVDHHLLPPVSTTCPHPHHGGQEGGAAEEVRLFEVRDIR